METNYSWKEVADAIGISENELIKFARTVGVLDEHGMPTDFAIKEGLLSVSVLSTEDKRRCLIDSVLKYYRDTTKATEKFVLTEIEKYQKMDEMEVERVFKFIPNMDLDSPFF